MNAVFQNSLVKRLTTSAIILTVVYCVIFYAPKFLFVIAMEGVILATLYEFFTLVERKGITINKALAYICGCTLPLFSFMPGGESIVIGATILAVFLVNFDKQQTSSSLVNVAVTLLGVLYVAWFLSFIMKIQFLEHGPQWVTFLITVTKGGDAGAYFIGTHFGKTKLMKHISPNKTIEGAVGEIIVTLLIGVGASFMMPYVGLWHLIAISLLLGVIAQLGDLVESLIKRDIGVKDSGVLPGLGGVLDVLDSLLFTAPVLFYYLITILKIS